MPRRDISFSFAFRPEKLIRVHDARRTKGAHAAATIGHQPARRSRSKIKQQLYYIYAAVDAWIPTTETKRRRRPADPIALDWLGGVLVQVGREADIRASKPFCWRTPLS